MHCYITHVYYITGGKSLLDLVKSTVLGNNSSPSDALVTMLSDGTLVGQLNALINEIKERVNQQSAAKSALKKLEQRTKELTILLEQVNRLGASKTLAQPLVVLEDCMASVIELLEIDAKRSIWSRYLWSGRDRQKFASLDEDLSDAIKNLQLALTIHSTKLNERNEQRLKQLTSLIKRSSETTSYQGSTPASANMPMCRHYAKGNCYWGSKCRFRHEIKESFSVERKNYKQRSQQSLFKEGLTRLKCAFIGMLYLTMSGLIGYAYARLGGISLGLLAGISVFFSVTVLLIGARKQFHACRYGHHQAKKVFYRNSFSPKKTLVEKQVGPSVGHSNTAVLRNSSKEKGTETRLVKSTYGMKKNSRNDLGIKPNGGGK